MADRANVLKGLECCTKHECGKECPYHDIDTGCRTDMEIDALTLLKEHEAVEPKAIGMNGFGYPVYACGKCGLLITESMNYCHECGKRIDWGRTVK